MPLNVSLRANFEVDSSTFKVDSPTRFAKTILSSRSYLLLRAIFNHACRAETLGQQPNDPQQASTFANSINNVENAKRCESSSSASGGDPAASLAEIPAQGENKKSSKGERLSASIACGLEKRLFLKLYPTGTFIYELRGQGYEPHLAKKFTNDYKNENFSRLARPLHEAAQCPDWDNNIPVGRIEDSLREMLIGPGRRYREGPTGLLIQQGKEGEFAYRAHKGRNIKDMPRSHGVGHWQDTFGTGGANVIAAASSLALAKSYRKEFIRDHGEEEKDVGLYMINLEGLEISYIDVSVALNFNIQEPSEIECIFEKHDGVSATEVHIKAPISGERLADITDIIQNDMSDISKSDYQNFKDGALPYILMRTGGNIKETIKPKNPAELQEEIELNTKMQAEAAENKNSYANGLRKYISQQENLIRETVSQHYPVSHTRMFWPDRSTRFFLLGIQQKNVPRLSSELWNSELLKAAIHSSGGGKKRLPKYETNDFFVFYSEEEKALILYPKRDLFFDFETLAAQEKLPAAINR